MGSHTLPGHDARLEHNPERLDQDFYVTSLFTPGFEAGGPNEGEWV